MTCPCSETRVSPASQALSRRCLLREPPRESTRSTGRQRSIAPWTDRRRCLPKFLGEPQHRSVEPPPLRAASVHLYVRSSRFPRQSCLALSAGCGRFPQLRSAGPSLYSCVPPGTRSARKAALARRYAPAVRPCGPSVPSYLPSALPPTPKHGYVRGKCGTHLERSWQQRATAATQLPGSHSPNAHRTAVLVRSQCPLAPCYVRNVQSSVICQRCL